MVLTEGNIQEVEPDSALYHQVLALSDRHRSTLGFLPYQVFRDAAASARLWADVADGGVRGYVLFRRRLRTGDISVTHLCVGEGYRGQGVARDLIEKLVIRHPNSPGIRLRCRNDFEAHRVWPKLGFTARNERLGRSQYLLTDWWRRIADWSLFDWAAERESRVVAVLDTDVFRDIAERRDFPESLALESDWVDGLVDLTITPGTLGQISGSEGRFPDLRPKASKFRTLCPSPEDWQATYNELLSLDTAVAGDEADVQIVAQAIAGKARFLITRDQGLLRATKEIEELYGLAILEPADLIVYLSTDNDYQPQFIANSKLRIEQLQRIPSLSELSRYCHYVDQQPRDLRRELAIAVASTTNPGLLHELRAEDGTGLALITHHLIGKTLKVTVLRRSPGMDPYSAMRQIVHFLRSVMVKEGGGRIEVLDQIDDISERALHDEGFEHRDGLWSAEARVGVIGLCDPLPADLQSRDLTPALISEFESKYWPFKVFAGVVPSYVVPVRPGFAKAILGYEEAQRELFGPPVSVAIARENVYYRSRRGSFRTPSRILWWVSGGGREGGMRAMSWLDAVDTGIPERLHRRYGSRGILTLDQVFEWAGTTRRGSQAVTTALLFSRTEVFSTRISIQRARQLHEPMVRNGYFQSIRPLEEAVVKGFYLEGMADA